MTNTMRKFLKDTGKSDEDIEALEAREKCEAAAVKHWGLFRADPTTETADDFKAALNAYLETMGAPMVWGYRAKVPK